MRRFDDQWVRLWAVGWCAIAALLSPATAWAQKEANGGSSELNRPLPPWADFLEAFLELNIGDIAVWRFVVAGLLVVVGIALRRFLIERMLSPVDTLLDRTETEYDDRALESIERPLRWLINVIAVYFALRVLDLPSELERVGALVLKTIGTVIAAWGVHNLIGVVVALLDDFAEETESKVDDYLVPVVGRVLRGTLYALVCVLIVQQWGYNVTSLLAGLGVGGLAFALAAKPTLSNWFGSLMIFTDRPFNIGDRIEIDAGEGIVEEVGMRSTRIRTRDDSLISIPNSEIASGPIENLSARRVRRIELSVRLTYTTTADQVREVVDGIQGLIDEHDRIDTGDAIVRFRDFGDRGLVVYVDCYAQTTDRATSYRIREEIHFGIADIVEEAGAALALPSRTLYFDDELEVADRDE